VHRFLFPENFDLPPLRIVIRAGQPNQPALALIRPRHDVLNEVLSMLNVNDLAYLKVGFGFGHTRFAGQVCRERENSPPAIVLGFGENI
jgi:hypothetical protein